MNKNLLIIISMFILAIFAVGCVSAEENVTADIDVPTDDIIVDDVTVEEEVENDVIEEMGNRDTYDVYDTYTSAQINTVINNAATTTHQVSFAPGTYNNTVLTLKSNVNLIGNGAKLVGTGTNHVITVTDCNNFTISGFEIDANYLSPANNISAIRGSNVENGVITNNVIYNAFNAVNIFKHYDNMTVSDNTIHDTVQDAISFANPITNVKNNINTLGYTYISGNTIYDAGFGIFIGGNFKGTIYDNGITNSTYGIQFKGKPDGSVGNIVAYVAYNNIGYVDVGIDMVNTTIVDLTIESNTILTNNPANDYTIYNGPNVSKATGGYLEFTDNYLDGCINHSLVSIADIFANIQDGTII